MASRLQQFYAGLVIFITGGTGFLGKLLLLKLLQSCPDIGGIITLLREKCGQIC
jgi:fatty acyl-CoA reductase